MTAKRKAQIPKAAESALPVTPRALLYCRVSSVKQTIEGSGLVQRFTDFD